MERSALPGMCSCGRTTDPADTLLPRFLAAGGDPRRVHFVTGSVDRDGVRQFDSATDIPALLTAARGYSGY
jgi:hypothetical protein